MRRGVSFKIPNAYGRYLSELLRPIEIERYTWLVGGEESYIVGDDGLERLLFPQQTVLDGETFSQSVYDGEQYLIFVNVKAFSTRPVADVETYEAYMDSDCEIALLIIDSTFVDLYCKDEHLLESLYQHALSCGYEDVAYLTDTNDTRTRLTIW
ncbi:DUF2691 family protein [Exiguobacterium sp.]|uniref:DUF2691 family protein n=1 Tax=Exiguobacterium sp. TaxID=44751 RepID=UPI00263B9680|nr:DUF2691 family protein [Exiguobacterium sp.]MCC5893332.1 DUF2691 family protein [Exiguobacterium sp.]